MIEVIQLATPCMEYNLTTCMFALKSSDILNLIGVKKQKANQKQLFSTKTFDIKLKKV